MTDPGRARAVAAIERALRRVATLVGEADGLDVVQYEGTVYVFAREAYDDQPGQLPNLHVAPGYHRDDALAAVSVGIWSALVEQ